MQGVSSRVLRSQVGVVLHSASLLAQPAALAVRPANRAMFSSLTSLAARPTSLALQPAALSGAFRGMAKRAKKATQAIRLVSQAGTGYFYTKRKNTKSNPEKLVLVKYDPRVNARVLFKEERIKK